MNHLVSIIIPTHNRSNLLKKAIKSCLNQTYKNIEIIVVDDNSNDNTSKVIKNLSRKYDNIKYIRLNQSSGANVARNIGIKSAKGYFITGLDDDDTMLPNRIEKLVKSFSSEYAYVYSRVYYKFNNKKKLKYFKFFSNEITLNDMLYYNCTGNQVLTTKEMFLKAGLYDERLESAQDYDMWLRLLLLKPKARLVKEPLMNINRENSINRISSSKIKWKGYFKVYKRYKKFMNQSQKKFQLFKLYFDKHQNISFRIFFLFFDYRYLIKYIYLNIKFKLNNFSFKDIFC